MTDGGVRGRAEHRLRILARQLEHVGLSGAVVVTEADPPGRDFVRRSAERAVARAGLDDVLTEARERFRAWVDRALNETRSDMKVIQYALGPSLGPVADRINVYMAVDDAVLGTAARELVPEEVRRDLLEPFERMMSRRGSPQAKDDALPADDD